MAIRRAALTVWVRQNWAVPAGVAIILMAVATLGLRGLGHKVEHASDAPSVPVQPAVYSTDTAEETWHIVAPANPPEAPSPAKHPEPQPREPETDWAVLAAGVADVPAASVVGALPLAGLETSLPAADRQAIIAAVMAEESDAKRPRSRFPFGIGVRRGGRGGVCR